MSAELVHAHEWDSGDIQNFVGLGVGRDEIFLYQFRGDSNVGWRQSGFDTENVVRTYEYSHRSPQRVGYGLNSGAVYVRDLYGEGGSLGPSDPLVFKQRTPRKCNAISFNDEMLMASGYEKVRGVESLLIWDLNAPDHGPVSSVQVNDTVSAARFVPTNPASLIFGGPRTLREFDLRANSITHSVSTIMYMPVAFQPYNDLNFATMGESNHIALWDRRMLRGDGKSSEPLLVIPRAFKENQSFETRCFRYSLLNDNEVAVLNDGATIRRWEISAMSSRTNNTSSAQYSQLTSGLNQHRNVPVSGNNAEEVEDDMTSLSGASDSGLENIVDGSNAASVDFPEDEYGDLLDMSLFVNKVYEVPTENDKVVSFDYARNTTTGRLDFVCLRQSGTVFRMPVKSPPFDIYLDPFNDFRMASESEGLVETTRSDHSRFLVTDMATASTRDDEKVERGDQDNSTVAQDVITDTGSTVPPPPSPSRMRSDNETDQDSESISGNSETEDNTSSESESSADFTANNSLSLPTLLTNDIACTMQRRALAGYSLDAAKNIDLLTSAKLNPSSGNSAVSGTSGLLAAWEWIKEQQLFSDGPRNYWETPELDLRYIGVFTLWNGTAEALIPRLTPDTKLSNRTLNDAVRHALKRSSGSVYVKEEDDKTLYRQLCLRLAGWDFGLNDLEARIEDLERHQMYEKAAGCAVFHNNVERAVESLANSRKRNLRLMSTAIAGYLVYKDVSTNNVWREQCRRLASEISVPYLRAIFAYISDGSWLDVLDDGSLPLTERLGIALRFLPQKEVGKYLSLVTSRAIANGELEGIILTGFTPKVIDLLQAYLDRSGDLQTVCLLVSFGWPRYFDDPRLARWFAEYRQLLNSWKYFTQRARLDIARSKLLRPRDPRPSNIQGQVFLRCNNCKRDFSEPLQNKGKGQLVRAVKQLRNRCIHCNHPLPLCGVCTLPLGPCLGDEIESDRWPTFCLKCNHGYHSVHARQWLSKYDVCPMPSCTCKCGKTL